MAGRFRAGPEDWPPLALRRSAAMTRNSSLKASNGLNGRVWLARPAIVEFQPAAGDHQQREAGAGLFVMNANLASFHRTAWLLSLLQFGYHSARAGIRKNRRYRFLLWSVQRAGLQAASAQDAFLSKPQCGSELAEDRIGQKALKTVASSSSIIARPIVIISATAVSIFRSVLCQ